MQYIQHEMTHAEIARELGITREGVRQIERRALKKVASALAKRYKCSEAQLKSLFDAEGRECDLDTSRVAVDQRQRDHRLQNGDLVDHVVALVEDRAEAIQRARDDQPKMTNPK